jgi:MFS family permease
VAALGYTVFTCGETLTRFAGDRAQERFGPVRLIGAGATLFAAGLLIILLSPSPWISIAGLAVAGVGIAPVNPIAFSAAGHCGGTDSGVAIGHYTTLSYGGVLGGPALVGALADGFGLGTALACLLVPAAVILLGAKATAPAAGTR